MARVDGTSRWELPHSHTSWSLDWTDQMVDQHRKYPLMPSHCDDLHQSYSNVTLQNHSRSSARFAALSCPPWCGFRWPCEMRLRRSSPDSLCNPRSHLYCPYHWASWSCQSFDSFRMNEARGPPCPHTWPAACFYKSWWSQKQCQCIHLYPSHQSVMSTVSDG